MNAKMIAVLAVAVLTLRAGFTVPKARAKGIEMLKDKRWLINFLVIVAFIIYSIYETRNEEDERSKKTKEALKKAIIAFLIALLAELGLTIAPFWLIFVLAYYMDGWI